MIIKRSPYKDIICFNRNWHTNACSRKCNNYNLCKEMFKISLQKKHNLEKTHMKIL